MSGAARKPRVVIAGGGVAGLECALALRDLAAELLDVTVVDPSDQLAYRPYSVGESFGRARLERFDRARLVAAAGATFEKAGVVLVDGDRKRLFTQRGGELSYDRLVIACGTRMRRGVPGAVTFWGTAGQGGMQSLVERLRSGALRRIVYTMPGGGTWGLPLYELALLARSELDRAGIRSTRVSVVTPEEAPLRLFGRHASEQMAALLEERGIDVEAGTYPVAFGDGLLRVSPGRPLPADAVVSLPRFSGRRIGGVPCDRDGFIPVDVHGRIRGLPAAFAAGDVTAFPVKQGGIAAQQADAVAEAIAAGAGARLRPVPFDPVLEAVLWTGEAPRFVFGRLAGGYGETSLIERELPPEAGNGKIVSRYLADHLREAGLGTGERPRAPGHGRSRRSRPPSRNPA